MILFLDSSVVLAACGRDTGASRLLFNQATQQGWVLLTSAYVEREVDLNLRRLSITAAVQWRTLRSRLQIMPDVVTFPWIHVAPPAKDRPILYTAAAWADWLITLDRRDFVQFLGTTFFSLQIGKPSAFLAHERSAGRWFSQS